MKTKLIASATIAGMAFAGVASLAPQAKAQTTTTKAAGKKGGTFIALNLSNGDPDHIDPALAHVVDPSQITSQLYDGLVDIDYDTGTLKPAVAESWKSNAAGDQVVFKLKKGVKFSNGEDVLPSSFKCAWERVLQPELASEVAYHLYAIKGAQAINDGKGKALTSVTADDASLTLTVNLGAPFTSFVANTQHTVFSPLPKAGCAANKSYEQGIMIGNGPFKMDGAWKHDQSIKIARNDSYYGGINGHTAYLDGVDFRITKDVLAAYNLFESGTGDNSTIPGGRFKEAQDKYGPKGNEKALLSINPYYAFNWNDPTVGGFANTKLRQAISMAIDRTQINQLVFNGTRLPATGVTPPGVPGYNSKLSTIKTSADVEGAKKLLASWGKPLPKITLRTNNPSANLQIAAIVTDNLKAIGIEVELDARPSTTYFSDLATGNSHQFFRSGWVYDYAGYDNGMYPLFHTATVGQDNSAKFTSALFDRYVNEARRTTDDAKQNSLYQQAEKVLLDQAIVIPMIWGRWGNVTSKRVDSYVQGATGFVDYNEVTLK